MNGNHSQLDEQQKDMVETPPTGILLGEARAGSGKTRVIRARVPFILRWRDQESNNFSPASGSGMNALQRMLMEADTTTKGSQMLVLAYGKAVAKEINDAFARELSKDDLKRVKVKTFHGQAATLLNRFAAQTPLRAGGYEVPKHSVLVQRMADTDACRRSGISRLQATALLAIEGFSAARGIAPDEAVGNVSSALQQILAMDPKEVSHWIDTLRSWRFANGLITYDDMLPLANALPDHCFAACEFQDVIADELQDLNFQQRALVKRFMTTSKSFTGMGDQFQTVHSWNGADPEVFNMFREEYRSRGVETKYLLTNYRCTEAVLAIANQILSKDLNTDKLIQGTGRMGPPVAVYKDGAEGLIRFLREREASGEAWKDMAVAYRTRQQSQALELALAESGIPYILKDSSFFEQREIMDVLAYIYMAYDPTPDYDWWRRIIGHYEYLGAMVAEVAWGETNGHPFKTGYTPNMVKNRSGMLSSWKAMQRDWAHLNVLSPFLPDNSPGSPVLKMAQMLKSQLLPYWVELYSEDEKLDEKIETVNALLKWIEAFGPAATGLDIIEAIAVYEQGNRHKEVDADAVTLSTAHRLKGLEFQSVALWNVSPGNFPMRAFNTKDRAAEDRLLYVATTRAKNALAFICPDEQSAAEVPMCTYVPDVRVAVSQMTDFDCLYDNYLDVA